MQHFIYIDLIKSMDKSIFVPKNCSPAFTCKKLRHGKTDWQIQAARSVPDPAL